jgi:hypothetical protein
MERPGNFEFSFEDLKLSHHLDECDILIFDPAFAHLNAHNLDYDGTRHYGEFKVNYMLRLRRFRGEGLSFSNYQAVYHIFQMCYVQFNARFPMLVDPSRQLIHLYPGGGYFAGPLDAAVDPASHIIVTMPFTDEALRMSNATNPRLSVYGGPMIRPCTEMRGKLRKSRPLVQVCFTSLGNPEQKGADTYVRIAEMYQQRYPADPVLFFGVGNVPASDAVVHVSSMTQSQLTLFYHHNIDIIFNLDRTKNMNGWPLGSEAMIEGAVLFSTDSHNMNEKTGFRFDFHRVDEANLSSTIVKIRQLLYDPDLLLDLSKKMQQRSFELFSFDATMGMILAYVERVASGSS